LLATAMSGLFLLAMGLFRLGTLIKLIPFPVTVGFTAGIAVIIFMSQVRDLLGLSLDGPEPAAILPKLQVLVMALPTIRLQAVAVAVGTIGLILALKRLNPQAPGMLIAVAAAAIAVFVLDLPVETIGSRFGSIASGLPAAELPPLDAALIFAVLPDAVAFAL